MNSVVFLMTYKFSNLSWYDKLTIKELGRPTPDLKIEANGSSRNKAYKRQFNKNIYVNTKWICGCDVKNAFFCFPCLLFGGDSSWIVNGIRDLTHLSQKIKRHEITKTHITNELNLALLGRLDIKNQLDSAYWLNIETHNETVTKNRYILSKIIDCIKFCGTFELALCRHDETEISDNPGIFRGLINFSAVLDGALHEHLRESLVFNGTSKDLQNKLLQCMLDVSHEKIQEEISQSNYLAIIADETSDVSLTRQLAIVLRYVRDSKPVERFWGFENLIKADAEIITQCIRQIIDPFVNNNSKKLIAQAYDGVAFMSSKHRGVQSRIKEAYPFAHFVHCYAHKLNLILSKATSQNKQVRVFFCNVDDIVCFFSNSPHRLAVLNEVIGKRIPHAVQTPLNFKNHSIIIIYEHRSSLIECMQKIQDEFNNDKVINQASAIERLLRDQTFLFWLNIFYNIMPHVDILYNQLQKRKTDVMQIKSNIENFESSIANIKENISEVIKEGNEEFEGKISFKRKHNDESEEECHIAALEVCDIITNTIKERFDFTNHLIVAKLFDSDCFKEYIKTFPDDIIKIAKECFPDIDSGRLKTELSIIYIRPEFKYINTAAAFLNMLILNNLEEPFKETVNLLKILLTIPMCTSEKERCFLTLKRIKDFLRNTMMEEKLSALAMLSIENKMIRSDINFNEKVIEKFSTLKDHCIELVYKK